jgi:uncharacterized membrane protein YfcA
MLISGFIGTVIGKQILVRMGARYFHPILNAILLLLAARLVWNGLEGLLGRPLL